MKSSNKSIINLIIDIILFFLLLVITGIGFLIKYILVPGFERNELYGKDVELYLWGLDRHYWGTIHLTFAFIFLFLLLIHIILHWNMIQCIYKRMIPHKTLRISLATFLIVTSAIVGIGPLFIKPVLSNAIAHHHPYNRNKKGRYLDKEVIMNPVPASSDDLIRENIDGNQSRKKRVLDNQTKNRLAGQHKNHGYKDIEVYGSMSLNDVSKKYGLSVTELATAINVPKESAHERLGRLKKQYGFQMNSLRRFIYSQTKQ